MCGFICILFLISSVAGSPLDCNTTAIEQCEDQFLTDMGVSGGNITQNITVLNALEPTEGVKFFCTASQTFQRCIDPFILNCYFDKDAKDSGALKVPKYITEMYAYMCYSQRADIIRYSECWNTEYVRNEISPCREEFMLTAYIFQDRCPSMEKALKCIGDVVNNKCGAKSASAYSYIMSNSFLTAFDTNGTCHNVQQTFGTIGKSPYETGIIPTNAAGYNLMNCAYVMNIAMFCLLSLFC